MFGSYARETVINGVAITSFTNSPVWALGFGALEKNNEGPAPAAKPQKKLSLDEGG